MGILITLIIILVSLEICCSVSSSLVQVIREGRDAAKEVLIRLVCLHPQIKLPDCCSVNDSDGSLTGLKAGTKNFDILEGKRGTQQIL